ncbi:MAG: oligopeptide transporter permease [Methanosaeta sp. PtaU1.Bin055]|nr:MAG: oligopeptide transporter permease [Methanosaeta sp. PtaU1.Bin055]
MKAEHLVRRVFYSLLAFMISVTLTFALLHLMPGDYLHSILPYLAEKNPDAARMFREQFCLNRPISEQYRLYIGNVFRGNWGYSFLYGLPVLAVIGEMLHWTNSQKITLPDRHIANKYLFHMSLSDKIIHIYALKQKFY